MGHRSHPDEADLVALTRSYFLRLGSGNCSARPARPVSPRGRHRHRCRRARQANSATFLPSLQQRHLSCSRLASRTGVPSSSVTRSPLEPRPPSAPICGSDLEDDCSGRPTFLDAGSPGFAPSLRSRVLRRPFLASAARLPCAPAPAGLRCSSRSTASRPPIFSIVPHALNVGARQRAFISLVRLHGPDMSAAFGADAEAGPAASDHP